MKKDDNLFDKKIRKKLKAEISYVPNNINEKIDEIICKGKKKRFSKKIISIICAASLAGIFLFGVTMPAYAKNIPIIGSIFEKFEIKRYENYDKCASDLNITKESNGVTITINKVVYDGIDLDVFFTVENLPENKFIDLICNTEINSKEVYLGWSQNRRHINGNKAFIGNFSFSMGTKSSVPRDIIEKDYPEEYIEIPDEFTLNLDLKSGNESSKENIIKGEWNFDIPVSNEKIKGKIKEKNANVDLSSICKNTYINKLITTPINTIIEMTTEDKNFNDFSFIVFDDKGRYIEDKGWYESSNINKNGEKKYYYDKKFKEIYEDTKSLTFIPSKFIELEDEFNDEGSSLESSKNRMIEIKLNLKGETKVKTNSGEDYATITRVNVERDKTKIYFKSKNSIYAAPFEIVDNNTGEKIKRFNEISYLDGFFESLGYSYDTDEYYVIFDKTLTSDNYSIKFYDISKCTKVYENKRFSLDIPK